MDSSILRPPAGKYVQILGFFGMGWDGFRLDGKGWDRFRLNLEGCDGMGWDWMGSD